MTKPIIISKYSANLALRLLEPGWQEKMATDEEISFMQVFLLLMINHPYYCVAYPDIHRSPRKTRSNYHATSHTIDCSDFMI